MYQNAPDAPKNEYDQTDADVYAEDNANENGGECGRQFGYTEFDDSPADLDQRADLSEALEFKVALGDLDLSKVTVPEGRIDLAQRVLDAYQGAAEAEADFFAGPERKKLSGERAIDALRAKFGAEAVVTGRVLR